MSLSRRDLELDRMRKAYGAGGDARRALNDEELSASLTSTLAAKPKGAGWWVFGYGSLLWNPLFPVAEMRAAMLVGLRRRFCLWSRVSRGTPDCPGLVLGLVPGGRCAGIALRLPAPLALDELHLLWRREMVVGAYDPRWLEVDAGGRRIIALAFVVRRDHWQYTGAMTIDAEADAIAGAAGSFGTSLDYLERTRVALLAHGIVDPYLERVARAVAACRSAAGG